MVIQQEQIGAFIQNIQKNEPRWVDEAKKQNVSLKALIKGEGFAEELINKIEKLESAERALVRKKYSKDIRDLFARVTKKRENIFDADGGSENNEIDNDSINQNFQTRINNFKANLSLFDYMENNYFQLADIDPNGVLLLEYKQIGEEFILYPTYKSIQNIFCYESNGQTLEYLLFKPIPNEKVSVKTWRLIDDEWDYTIKEVGGTFIVDDEKSFEHPFGKVPGLILSNRQITGSELRQSYCNDILELAEEYARDKSILTIYKFQKGFPIHWRYGSKANKGLDKEGNNRNTSVDEKGNVIKQDVSDVYMIPIPKEGQPNLGDKIAGFTSPDLETWNQYKQELKDLEVRIEDTLWGTDKTSQSKHTSETATGRYIDVQPISNTLNNLSGVAEYVYNTICNWTLNFIDQTKDKKEIQYLRTFGRRYIIESPDALLDKYEDSKEKGCNNLILDKLLNEFILSKYKSDPVMQSLMLKKAYVEPYIHQSIKEVNEIFGAYEANKKIMFQVFWQNADTSKTAQVLKQEFETYNQENNQININQNQE